jgi:hypothetical protein
MKNPKMTVCIHNDGTNVRHQKAILVMGQAVIHDDDALMRDIHWQIIDKYFFELTTDEERAAVFEAVHTPLRCIIEVVPEKILTWDLGKMLDAHDEGVWYGESQKLVEKRMAPEYLFVNQRSTKEVISWVSGTISSNATPANGRRGTCRNIPSMTVF